jgi:hypothetical protein
LVLEGLLGAEIVRYSSVEQPPVRGRQSAGDDVGESFMAAVAGGTTGVEAGLVTVRYSSVMQPPVRNSQPLAESGECGTMGAVLPKTIGVAGVVESAVDDAGAEGGRGAEYSIA